MDSVTVLNRILQLTAQGYEVSFRSTCSDVLDIRVMAGQRDGTQKHKSVHTRHGQPGGIKEMELVMKLDLCVNELGQAQPQRGFLVAQDNDKLRRENTDLKWHLEHQGIAKDMMRDIATATTRVMEDYRERDGGA